MNCVEVKQNIEALLDGELNKELENSVEDHLRICHTCRETKDEKILLSSVLQTLEIVQPSEELDNRLANAFRKRHQLTAWSSWRKIAFGAVAIPKAVFAAILVLVVSAPWIAFEIGRINATTISMPAPLGVSSTGSVPIPVESKTELVVVEIPVIRERTVTRTVYVHGAGNGRNREIKRHVTAEPNILSSYTSIANNRYITDVDLQGFQPPAEIGVQIIKEVKQK